MWLSRGRIFRMFPRTASAKALWWNDVCLRIGKVDVAGTAWEYGKVRPERQRVQYLVPRTQQRPNESLLKQTEKVQERTLPPRISTVTGLPTSSSPHT